MQFQKGQSGNPAGRQPGSRNKRTILAEQLFDERAEGILTKILDDADEGDPASRRLCLDRIAPRLRDRPVIFQLPPMQKASDAAAAMAAVTQGLADGELTAREAADLGAMIEKFTNIIVATDHEERINKLEKNAEEMKAKEKT